jgi:thiol-disulfide isomerase/thioredoxin
MYSIILALMLSISLGTVVETQSNETVIISENEPKVLAVRMYADWCGNCKILDPKVDSFKEDFSDGRVVFIRLDQTEDFDTAQSELLAGLIGIKDVFLEYKGKTGMMLLIDAKTKKLLEVVTHRNETDEIKAKIAGYLN